MINPPWRTNFIELNPFYTITSLSVGIFVSAHQGGSSTKHMPAGMDSYSCENESSVGELGPGTIQEHTHTNTI